MLTPALQARLLNPSQPIGGQLLAILRDRIVRGDLAPGVRLSEAGVAAEFQVSRQPVREVFIKLAEIGLLEVRPQRGTVVPKISVDMVLDVRFVREAIEAEVVKLAAERFESRDIARLDELIWAQRRTTGVQDFMELDDLFHRTLAEGVGRSHAWHVIEALKAQLDRVRYLSLQQFPKTLLIAQHARIVDTIRAGSSADAEAAMRRHLNKIVDDLPKIAADHPGFFEGASESRLAKTG